MPHFSPIFTQEGNALHSSHPFPPERGMYDSPLHSPYSKGSGRARYAALPLQSKLTYHFGISAEHVEVVNFDFGDIFFISIFVCIVAVDEFAFDHNLFAFGQIFFSFFGRPTPSNEAVPGGVFDNLTIVVFVNFIGDEGESGHFPTPFNPNSAVKVLKNRIVLIMRVNPDVRIVSMV
jgi:hypothetical protein